MHTVLIKSSIEAEGIVSEMFRKILNQNIFETLCNIPFISSFSPLSFEDEVISLEDECIVFFEDGNSARLKFVKFYPDSSFCVRVDRFTSIRLIALLSAEYQFNFVELNSQSSFITADYKFKFRSSLFKNLFRIFFKKFMTNHISMYLDKLGRVS